MGFIVLIPARLASVRLPDKPLADIAGLPMVVRVAQRAALSGAERVVVAADHPRIISACEQHGVEAVLTGTHHATGSDRLAQACELLGLAPDRIVVNVQGDEPLLPPELIDAVAQLLAGQPLASMSTAAHEIHAVDDLANPNIVKVVLDSNAMALYFSRAPIPWKRDEYGARPQSLLPPPCRCGTSGSMPTELPFCALSRSCRWRRWNAWKRSNSCAPSGTGTGLPCTSVPASPARPLIRQMILNEFAGCSSRPELRRSCYPAAPFGWRCAQRTRRGDRPQ